VRHESFCFLELISVEPSINCWNCLLPIYTPSCKGDRPHQHWIYKRGALLHLKTNVGLTSFFFHPSIGWCSDGQWCRKNVQKKIRKTCFSECGAPNFVGTLFDRPCCPQLSGHSTLSIVHPVFIRATLASVGISCRHVSVCSSARLSQVGVLPKRLNV